MTHNELRQLPAGLLLVMGLMASACLAQEPSAAPEHAKTLIDYFLPMPIRGELSKDAWGAPGVLPRDQKNGLEDATIQKWDYWDGQIVKSPDGKYHLFASRWDHSKGHKGWTSSAAVHAVSDNVIGPYEDTGMPWPDNMGGKGHNVTALIIPDGRYYDPTVDFIRYTDGTVNHWEKIERPAVFIENGHVTHFTFAAIDIPKEENKGNDRHGSKVIVVPFDGAAMDRDLAEIVKREKAESSGAAAR